MSDDTTSITIRLPKSLRKRLKEQAKKQERSESQFVRFYLSQVLSSPSQKAAR